MTVLRRPLLDRFMEKFVVDQSGCWLWTAKTSRGYGQIVPAVVMERCFTRIVFRTNCSSTQSPMV